MPLSFSELSGRYNELWRETSALYEAWARQNGLSYHELLVVLSIAQARGPCTQKTICAQWAVPKQTVHSVLQGFLARGLVRLCPAPGDRRNKQIECTPQGRVFFESTAQKLDAHEAAVWRRMGAQQSKALLACTALYNRFFREECAP